MGEPDAIRLGGDDGEETTFTQSATQNLSPDYEQAPYRALGAAIIARAVQDAFCPETKKRDGLCGYSKGHGITETCAECRENAYQWLLSEDCRWILDAIGMNANSVFRRVRKMRAEGRELTLP